MPTNIELVRKTCKKSFKMFKTVKEFLIFLMLKILLELYGFLIKSFFSINYLIFIQKDVIKYSNKKKLFKRQEVYLIHE